jgi:hypothetical protein
VAYLDKLAVSKDLEEVQSKDKSDGQNVLENIKSK